ncbi:MAG: S-layer protein [Methanolinea sp.]|nr:S-layer protein [Methanolinea sp.]
MKKHQSSPKSWKKKIPGLLFCVLFAGVLAVPVCAGERYLGGNPELSAAVRGSNEFYPGEDVTIPVVIQNSGLIEYTFTYPTTLTPVDMPSTAKLMTVALGPGDAPLIITSDPQMVGDLKGGSSVGVNFNARVLPDAQSGTYIIPLNITYTYLDSAEQYGQDALHYHYKQKAVTLALPVHVKGKIIPDVSDVTTESVFAGSEGYLSLRLRNAGNEEGRDSVVRLARSGTSPLTPLAGSIFMGRFPPGDARDLRFKVAAARDAVSGVYPVDIVVDYTDSEGKQRSSDPLTIGVPVGGKMTFEVATPPDPVSPGSKGTLKIAFRNTGSFAVTDAQVRLYPADPFMSDDDLAYLGDMLPGETKVARFEVTVDRDATVKEYGLDTEIRFRDTLGNDQVSDRIKVPVEVVPLTGVMAVLGNPGLLVLIVIVVLVGAYLVVTRRKWFTALVQRKSRERKDQ